MSKPISSCCRNATKITAPLVSFNKPKLELSKLIAPANQSLKHVETKPITNVEKLTIKKRHEPIKHSKIQPEINSKSIKSNLFKDDCNYLNSLREQFLMNSNISSQLCRFAYQQQVTSCVIPNQHYTNCMPILA